MRRTLSLVVLLPFLLGMAAGPEEDFWVWFQANEAALFALDLDGQVADQKILLDLAEQLQRIRFDLTFEIDSLADGRRELVITAEDVKRAFAAVESLVAKAPALPRWKVTAFRPRRAEQNTLSVAGFLVDPKDVYVQLYRDESKKVGLVLFMRGYSGGDRTVFGQAAFVFLDRALGERDVETKVGIVELKPLGAEAPKDAVPLADLPKAFDAFATQKP
jgi:hypothetical protein